MNKLCCIGLILILVTATLIGCGSSEYIPNGSAKTATFEGNLTGEQMVSVLLRGTVAGNQLNGQLQAPADGSISGSLSPDGNQIKGNYTLTSPSTDSGTWKALKK